MRKATLGASSSSAPIIGSCCVPGSSGSHPLPTWPTACSVEPRLICYHDDMSVSLKSLGIEQLSVDERLALVEELWDSIAEATPLTDAQRAELDRRLAEHEADPDGVVPWEDIKASIAARLKR